MGGRTTKSSLSTGSGEVNKTSEVNLSSKQSRLQDIISKISWKNQDRKDYYNTQDQLDNLLNSLPVGTVIDTNHNFGVIKLGNNSWDTVQVSGNRPVTTSWVRDRLSSDTGVAKAYPKDLRVKKSK